LAQYEIETLRQYSAEQYQEALYKLYDDAAREMDSATETTERTKFLAVASSFAVAYFDEFKEWRDLNWLALLDVFGLPQWPEDLKPLFDELHQRHRHEVRRTILSSLSCNPDLSANLTDDVNAAENELWEWVWLCLPTFRGQNDGRVRAPLRGYIRSNVTRTFKTLRLRAKKRYAPLGAIESNQTARLDAPHGVPTFKPTVDHTPATEQGPRLTGLFCRRCGVVKPFRETSSDGTATLACGHARPLQSD